MKISKIFKKYNLEKSPVYELNPNRNYIIAVNTELFSNESAEGLQRELQNMGINNVVAGFSGNPNKGIKIIKRKKGKL